MLVVGIVAVVMGVVRFEGSAGVAVESGEAG
jgi:hypothetical protein